jgi:hypothetical protein
MFYDDFSTGSNRKRFDDPPEVQELIRKRDLFLKNNPDLRSTQKEIDTLLSTTLDPALRLEILFMLIADKLGEMRNVFEEVLNLARLMAKD